MNTSQSDPSSVSTQENSRPTSSAISRTAFRFALSFDDLSRRKGIGVGHSHPHIPPQEEMRCKGVKGRQLSIPLLPSPLPRHPKTPHFQSRQILPVRQYSVALHLLPQRSLATGERAPSPSSVFYSQSMEPRSLGGASPLGFSQRRAVPFCTCTRPGGNGWSRVYLVDATGLRGPGTGKRGGENDASLTAK